MWCAAFLQSLPRPAFERRNRERVGLFFGIHQKNPPSQTTTFTTEKWPTGRLVFSLRLTQRRQLHDANFFLD